MANVKLSNVIRRAQTKVDKDDTDLVFYVGGEHIESENIRVHSRGIIAESTIGPMFYYGFKAGDFLLVSRNPHLKKAGLVDFDGICSEKTFVLETANSDVLLPEFLPFVLQNERFWDYAYRHRHGSTNTFINWSTLANYEFELPDLETQRKLAEVLWSINDTMEAYKNLISATDELVKSQFMEQFGDPSNNVYGYPVTTLKEVAVGPLSYGSVSSATEFDGITRYVRITDIMDDGNLGGDIKSATKTDAKYLLHEGDILFARTGATVGKTCRYRENYGRAIYAGFLIRLIPDTTLIDPDYLYHFTKSDYYWDFVRSAQRVVAQPNINAQEYGDLQILLPKIEAQKSFAAFVQQSDKSKFAIQCCSNLNLWSSSVMPQPIQRDYRLP